MPILTKSFITAIHLAALSQVESGDKDSYVGPQFEVSRYQILPAVWNETVQNLQSKVRGSNSKVVESGIPSPRNAAFAAVVAETIWEQRVETFRLAIGREPNLQELYLCWHRPARVLNPLPREVLRARRFENMVGALTAENR